jgi:hypothetical protein
MPWFGSSDGDNEDMEPGNPDQPPPAGLCPAGPGPHDWNYSGHIRRCSRCGASEAV